MMVPFVDFVEMAMLNLGSPELEISFIMAWLLWHNLDEIGLRETASSVETLCGTMVECYWWIELLHIVLILEYKTSWWTSRFQVDSSIEVEWKLFVWSQERYKSSHTAGFLTNFFSFRAILKKCNLTAHGLVGYAKENEETSCLEDCPLFFLPSVQKI